MITLLHPSRKRAAKAKATLEYWLAQSSKKIEIEHILSIDEDDPEAPLYNRIFPNSRVIQAANTCVVDATNIAAKLSKGDILIYLSDDFKCPTNWDESIVLRLKNETPQLVKVDDCLQPFTTPVLTIPIMNRKLYERLGYFWYGEYKSQFVDEDLYWVAANNGWLEKAPDLKFEHEHHTRGKAVNDDTYRRSEANWNQGKALFAKRKLYNFPL